MMINLLTGRLQLQNFFHGRYKQVDYTVEIANSQSILEPSLIKIHLWMNELQILELYVISKNKLPDIAYFRPYSSDE